MPNAVLASAWVSSRHASVGAVPRAPADGAPGAFDAEAVAVLVEPVAVLVEPVVVLEEPHAETIAMQARETAMPA
jgi:hypothetical protein